MNKAIFLDKDGTITVDTGYTYKVEDLKFEDNALIALRLLQTPEYLLIIVTGQSGIGRGMYTEQDYHKFMKAMYEKFRLEGINIDGEYFCPHHPKEGIGKYKIDCECRKPKIGMLEQAAREFNIDLSQSWVIGDKTDDIEMGRRAGCRTILVRAGKCGKDKNFDVKPDYTANDLLEAAAYVIANPFKT
ncbi:HAD family hydrolase [Candidatus Woesearchaeota archaeon]|nr:HAD family hydrolase [Candidatus Woesearchaeota archaeon]